MEHLVMELLIRTTLIVIVTGAALWALRIRAAASRYTAWLSVVVAMLLLPAWVEFGAKVNLPVLPAQPAIAATPAIGGEIAAPIAVVAAGDVKPRSRVSWSDVCLGIYVLGLGVLLLRLAVGTIRARRLTSASCSTPMTLGLLRARIVLPESASAWTQAQLDAVMAHEREHVRRRDPLFRWLVLLNRAIFWFHPLAWWLERRLAALAEEACDAVVLEQGHDPREYSMFLIEIARVAERAGIRVNGVAMGMPGSHLPSRVRTIMNGIPTPRVSRMRLALSGVICTIPAVLFASGEIERAPQLLRLSPLPALVTPRPPEMTAQVRQAPVPKHASQLLRLSPLPALVIRPPEMTAQVSQAPVPKLVEFEAATIQPAAPPMDPRTPMGGPGTSNPERINYPNLTIKMLLTLAYGMPLTQIIGPSWIDVDRFHITAKVPPGATKQDVNVMLQSLLADRLKLVVHRETREMQLYELTVAAGGSKLKSSVGELDAPKRPFGMVIDKNHPLPPPGETLFTWGRAARQIAASRATVGSLANTLGMELGRPVVDKTGLTGFYDYVFKYHPGPSPGDGLVPFLGQSADDAPDLSAALTEQLGLKLEPETEPIEVLVVDGGEKTPREN